MAVAVAGSPGGGEGMCMLLLLPLSCAWVLPGWRNVESHCMPPSLPYSWLLHVDMCLVSSLQPCGWGWRHVSIGAVALQERPDVVATDTCLTPQPAVSGC